MHEKRVKVNCLTMIIFIIANLSIILQSLIQKLEKTEYDIISCCSNMMPILIMQIALCLVYNNILLQKKFVYFQTTKINIVKIALYAILMLSSINNNTIHLSFTRIPNSLLFFVSYSSILTIIFIEAIYLLLKLLQEEKKIYLEMSSLIIIITAISSIFSSYFGLVISYSLEEYYFHLLYKMFIISTNTLLVNIILSQLMRMTKFKSSHIAAKIMFFYYCALTISITYYNLHFSINADKANNIADKIKLLSIFPIVFFILLIIIKIKLLDSIIKIDKQARFYLSLQIIVIVLCYIYQKDNPSYFISNTIMPLLISLYVTVKNQKIENLIILFYTMSIFIITCTNRLELLSLFGYCTQVTITITIMFSVRNNNRKGIQYKYLPEKQASQ
ncbi:hypothetical protein GUI12_04405 [Anaplasmataceae bacterium AB001_6]|nr:hypothetical protein GUI12_04405 [Anaplasmataceae bacterium AB001_6]